MEKLKQAIEKEIKKLELIVSEIKYVKGQPNILYITLDSDNIIDSNKIVEATNIISPIVDKYDPIDDEYVLDISSKEKGVEENE